MTVLILCAGNKYQWEINENVAQQLLPIAGTTVLRRTVAQVGKHGYEPVVVTHRDDIRNHVPDVEFFEPATHVNIADTWYSTQELWEGQVVILFGDVVYGEKTIEQTLKYRGGLMAIGDSAEIFAFTYQEADYSKLTVALGVERLVFPGAPWVIYRRWRGIPLDSSNRDKGFKWVWDRTADIDSMREYREALKIWGK